MPHDANGKVLSVGDRVNIPAIVTSVQATADYCNASVEFVHKMPPDNTVSTLSAINTKQLEKVE